MTVPTTIIIDGINVFFRHFAANPTINKNGEAAGGIVGFLGSIRDVATRFGPRQIIVAWEGGGSKKRRGIDASYKGGRRPIKLNRFYDDDIPDSIANRNMQVKKLVAALKLLPIRQVYVPDCEGDDIVSHLVNIVLRDSNDNIIIVSSDRDFYQLISDRVCVWSPGRRLLIDKKGCLQEFGVSPCNFCLAKAIAGDTSDQIRGVPGIGFKTLSKFIPAIASEVELNLDTILDTIRFLQTTSKIKSLQTILDYQEKIKHNIRLISLDAGNVPGDIVKRIEAAYDSDHTMGSPNKLELYRMMARDGLNKFDIDSLFISICRTYKNG